MPFAAWFLRAARLRASATRDNLICPAAISTSLDVDRYDFAIRVVREHGRPVARRENPQVTT